jgi:gas vesicle protein
MEYRKLRGVLAQYKSFNEQAEYLLHKYERLDSLYTKVLSGGFETYSDVAENVKDRIGKVRNDIKALVQSYNNTTYDASEITGLKLRAISVEGTESVLHQLMTECDKVVGALDEEVALSSKIRNKIEDLKEEATKICKNLDLHFEKNINESLMELEKGHFLASALITSRVVDYTLKQIKGQKIEDKIDTLIEAGAIEESRTKRQQQTEKISRLTRNLYNHRIDMYAKPSDALSLLSDCLLLLEIYEKTLNNKEE